MKAPQGVEKVVALATLSAEWRAKVLANPVAAAAEAGIELGESERGVLGSISRQMLAGMIDGFGKSVPRPAGLGKLAAGAAAALLVSSLIGCGDDRPHPPCKGILPSNPPPNPRKEDPDAQPKPSKDDSERPFSYGMRSDMPSRSSGTNFGD